MPPPMKRTFATTDLDDGVPTPKRGPFAEVVSLSSNDELEALDVDGANDWLSDDFDVEYDDDEEEAEEREEEEGDDGSQESQGYHYHRSRNLIEQLQKDAFDDFKADICVELDCLHESAADPARPEDDRAEGLRDVLREWIGQDKASRRTNSLFYRLDYAYDDNQFPPEVFLRRDAVVVETLDRIVGELDLEIFLALLDREDSGPTPNYLVRSLVDRHGHELISDIPVEDNLVQTRVPPLEGRPLVSEVAVMLVPRDSVVDFLMQYIPVSSTATLCFSRDIFLDGLANYFRARILESSNRNRLLPVFREFCVSAWQVDEAKGLSVLSRPVLNDLLEAVVNIEDWAFLEQAAGHLGRRPLSFFTWIADRVASGSLPLPKVEKSLLAAASTSTGFSDTLVVAYRLTAPRTPENACTDFSRQLIMNLPEVFDAKESCSYVGHFLVDLFCITQGAEGLEVSKLLRIAEKNLSNSSFLLGVLNGLHLRAVNGTPTQTPIPSALGPLFDRIARLLINNLDVSKLFRRGSHEFQCHGCSSSDQLACKPGHAGPIDACQFSSVISQLLAEGADSVVACFAFKVVADVALIPREEFTSFWIPFLGYFIKILEDQNVPLSTPRYRHLFAAILETYLTRCVGALPFTWTPKSKEIDCRCDLCRLFYLFLINSVSAASFRPVSPSKVHHLNTYLIPQAYKNNRCRFAMEDGSLVVRKLEGVDAQSRKSWTENKEKAIINLRQLDGPALRQILGEDYARIWDSLSIQMPPGCSPVPIESLERPLPHMGLLRPHQLPASMALAASPSSAHRLGNNRPPNPQGRLQTTNSPIPSSSTNRPTPAPYVRTIARTPRNPKRASHDQGGLLTPVTSSRTQPLGTTQAYRETFLMSRGWDSLRSKEREADWRRAERERMHPTPLPPSTYRPRPTPKASACMTPSSSRSAAALQDSPSLVGRRTVSGTAAARGPRPSVTVSSPRPAAATMQPSSPSLRVFGPISSGRLNSISTGPSQSRIKTKVGRVETEVVKARAGVGRPPASSSRGAKKHAPEVIDLTGDD